MIWNPHVNKAKAMGDFDDDGWTAMACVEPGIVASDRTDIAPGASLVLSQTIAPDDPPGRFQPSSCRRRRRRRRRARPRRRAGPRRLVVVLVRPRRQPGEGVVAVVRRRRGDHAREGREGDDADGAAGGRGGAAGKKRAPGRRRRRALRRGVGAVRVEERVDGRGRRAGAGASSALSCPRS